MRRRIDIACGLVVRPEVVFLDEPTTGLDPRSRQSIWDLVSDFKEAGIATLLTTQYLEEADALSDRIIVIDHGTIIAEGTADELKERTGATYCEIVPRDLKDLPAMVEALGSLLPEKNRAALTTASDRIAMPAPDGPNTLVEALCHLSAANIELADIALRRPSLDEVFFALTSESTGDESATRVEAGKPGHASGGGIAWSAMATLREAHRSRRTVLVNDIAAVRPATSTVQQWWVLTVRVIMPTLRNGELVTQIAASVMFTVGFYIPLKQIMGAFTDGMSSYAQYLMPLIALQAISFAAISAAFRSATDSVQGINRRFRAMPIAPLTPLAARMSASMYRCCIALAISLACGHVIGFRFYGGVAHTVGFWLLVLLIGVVLSLLGDLIGAANKNPEATTPLLMLPLVVLGLLSVGLQPVERFPRLDTSLRSQSADLPVRLRAARAGRGQDARGRCGELVCDRPALIWLAGCTA